MKVEMHFPPTKIKRFCLKDWNSISFILDGVIMKMGPNWGTSISLGGENTGTASGSCNVKQSNHPINLYPSPTHPKRETK